MSTWRVYALYGRLSVLHSHFFISFAHFTLHQRIKMLEMIHDQNKKVAPLRLINSSIIFIIEELRRDMNQAYLLTFQFSLIAPATMQCNEMRDR